MHLASPRGTWHAATSWAARAVPWPDARARSETGGLRSRIVPSVRSKGSEGRDGTDLEVVVRKVGPSGGDLVGQFAEGLRDLGGVVVLGVAGVIRLIDHEARR